MPKLSSNITVCIFAYNEQARLERCVRNFSGLFDILVIDNCSTDGTPELATSLGCRCVTIRNPGFIETPQVMDPVLAEVKTDYVLVAMAGEFVPLALLEKYAEVANAGAFDVVLAFRVSVSGGKPIPFGASSGRWTRHGQMRCFRRGAISYAGNQVHGMGHVTCTKDKVVSVIEDPSGCFYQFRDYDVSWSERKHATYNDILAKQLFDSGARFSWLRLLYRSLKAFFDSYLRFGSYRYGMLGFIHSYYRLHMEVGIWLRIWEHQNSLDRNGVIAENNKAREKLEKADRELRLQRGLE
jgi:glycosyltransferase involved in cell wall biosynthesis